VPDASSGSAYLVDDRAKVAHALSPQSTSIGRDASNEIVIRDPSASRFHAEIRQENDAFVLRSMGATGTLLNTKPLDGPHTLTEGDSVEIAFVRLRFTHSLGEGISEAPPNAFPTDEVSRRGTIDTEVIEVDDDNLASRDLRKIQLTVLVLAVLVGLWWLATRS
jgi:pSer/pThr/pTyr-binding forkhead associated (FHA) protein